MQNGNEIGENIKDEISKATLLVEKLNNVIDYNNTTMTPLIVEGRVVVLLDDKIVSSICS